MFQRWTKTRWVLFVAGLLLVIASSYASLSFFRQRPLNSLALPVLVGFIWLSCYKQKLVYALFLVGAYIIFAVPLIVFGQMDTFVLYPVLSVTGLTVLGMVMYQHSGNRLVILIAPIVFGAVILALFVLRLIDRTQLLINLVGGLGGVVGWLLFHPKASPSKT